MKQVLQSLSTGKIVVETVPMPQLKQNEILIETRRTLISAGTERMLLNFGKASILGKIKQQPDKVAQVLEKIKTDGLFTTLDAVKAKLDQPIPLGYCNVGSVLEAGLGVQDVKTGDRVVSNGQHAEIVRAPKNLCVKVPDSVSDEEAAFTIIAAIALQGVRLVKPTLGECIVVQGLGLVGLITVQLLVANGCRVLGVDFDSSKLELARSFGASTVDLSAGEDLVAAANKFSRGRGVDGVLITASTKSSEPVHQAATISRKRGRIVLVGVTGLELSRADFYEKELSFQVSCSYGPGRYDSVYEDQGHDYPIGFVRWTEQRNFEAVLDMMASGKVDVTPLISKTFHIKEAVQAYEALEDCSNLGILLSYPQDDQANKCAKVVDLTSHESATPKADACAVKAAFIGAGNYASRMLMPAFKAAGAGMALVVTSQGVSGVIHGKKLGIAKAGTMFSAALEDAAINTIVIATRHDLHASQVIDALNAGKHVFVEKPLAITQQQQSAVEDCYKSLVAKGSAPLLMLGFNRRFSPQIKKIHELLQPIKTPKNFVMTVNAGFIPANHWTQDPDVGGGRLLGEACHFIDLLRFLSGSKITHADISSINDLPEGAVIDENVSISLQFSDGSQGTVHYFANGHKAFPKERLEIFAAGKVIQLDNFRKLKAFGFSGFKKMNLLRQDKGQKNCAAAFVRAVKEGVESPISWEEIFEVSQVCLDLKAKLSCKVSHNE